MVYDMFLFFSVIIILDPLCKKFLIFFYLFFNTFRVIYQAVLEKQSYMLIGRHDIENLMRIDPASACLPNSLGQSNSSTSDADSLEVELEMGDLLLNLRPIKQVSIQF